MPTRTQRDQDSEEGGGG